MIVVYFRLYTSVLEQHFQMGRNHADDTLSVNEHATDINLT